MSDSESDLLPGNVFTFQNENTTVCAKGPSISSANYTNLSFRNNVMTSTMHMSRNFGRQRYGEPSFDQRSLCYRRETSPMSLYSGSDMRGRNQSYYHGGMSSQRSMYNGRSGSPMSMRSIDSNASVSAVDIALAFKNVNFNKYDLRMIKEAYNKFMKRRIRKKIEKRRNMRLFLKGYRRKSGYDSGELGSDSSISSDECKSTTFAMYKDNMSSCRSTRTDVTDFRKRIRDSNMYKDCTDNFKQNTIKNMFSVPPANSRDRLNATSSLPASTVQSHHEFTQKDRFKNGFLLPSQRFNKSVASVPIPERDRLQKRQNTLKPDNHTTNGYRNTQERVNNETDSDQEQIFSEITVREKSIQNVEHNYDKITDLGKRSLEIEESCSNRKRPKLSSPVKQQVSNGLVKDAKVSKKTNAKTIRDNNGSSGDNNIEPIVKQNNDFEFIKPQLPVRKSGPAKTKEKLISKSAPPLKDTIIPQSITHSEATTVSATKASVSKEKQATAEEQPDATQNSTNDMSMRPSFIKRKLFSQKMDVTERKNISNDAINVNSPQTNVYSAIQNEKHKARKLVTNQSCLSRDVVTEDNNLLDLIHKIVPPDRMNVTNVTNKTSISTTVSSKTNPVDEDDKWDVTSVISTCNNDDVSDTYTDEEIFAMDEKKKTVNGKIIKDTNKINNNVNTLNKINKCEVLVKKLPENVMVSTNPVVQVNKTNVLQESNSNNDNLKKRVYNCVKSFWDTDFESDVESSMPKKRTLAVKENQIAVKESHSKSITMEADETIKNKNTLNISLASVSESIKSKTMPTNNMGKLKFNVSKHLSIKSFLSPKHKKSKVKDQKILKDNQQKGDCSSKEPFCTEPESETKQSNKQTTTSKSKKNDLNNKNIELKKTKKSEKDINHKSTPSPKTKNKKTTQPANKPKNNNRTTSLNKTKNNTKSTQLANETKTNNKTTHSANENKPNNKVTQSLTKQKSNLTHSNEAKNNNKSIHSTNKKTKSNNKPPQSPNHTTKTVRPQNNNSAEKTVAIRSISVRSVRTPKRKACCSENPSPVKPVTKSNENPNKKLKLVDNIACKGKPAMKTNKPTANNQKNNSNKNKKKVEPETDLSIVNESETSNRILRSRRIDLSSSLNSSTENFTSLKLRSLRTRRVDLSSSLKNSSLDVTIIKNSRSKAQAKNSAKPGYAELLDKRQRR